MNSLSTQSIISVTMPYRTLFWRKLENWVVQGCSLLALTLTVGAMLWILWSIFVNGSEALNWGFLTNPSKPYGIPNAGIANAFLGTLMITFGATAIAVPLALTAGIGLAEFGGDGRLCRLLRFCANIQMGMPSIIVGLFTYMILVVPMKGFSGLAGSVALAIIMFPVITRTTEEMLRMVPDALREAGLALGFTRSHVTLQIICRAAKNGLVTGILLAVARVSGETAPLLFTALFADAWPKRYFTGPTANVPVLITEYATNSPFEAMHQAGWGAAFVITLFVLVLNIITRIFFRNSKH